MRKQVYSQAHGLIWVDTDEKYNGRTIEEIEKLPFKGWSDHDKKLYLKNCAEVISLQLTGDFGAAESIKNSNFSIAKNILTFKQKK